jgi:hypothetical protein
MERSTYFLFQSCNEGEYARIHAQEGIGPSSGQERQPHVDVTADSTGMLPRVSRETEIVMHLHQKKWKLSPQFRTSLQFSARAPAMWAFFSREMHRLMTLSSTRLSRNPGHLLPLTVSRLCQEILGFS